MSKVLLIGIGNLWRGDDAAGLHLARRLRQRLESDAPVPEPRILELSGEAGELLDAWQGGDLVVVVDAVSSGAEAGTLHRYDAMAGPLPARLASPTTHGWGVAQAVELGRALGRLPRRLIIYGIEGQDFDTGRGLTPAVERAVEDTAERLFEALGADGKASPGELEPVGDWTRRELAQG